MRIILFVNVVRSLLLCWCIHDLRLIDEHACTLAVVRCDLILLVLITFLIYMSGIWILSYLLNDHLKSFWTRFVFLLNLGNNCTSHIWRYALVISLRSRWWCLWWRKIYTILRHCLSLVIKLNLHYIILVWRWDVHHHIGSCDDLCLQG